MEVKLQNDVKVTLKDSLTWGDEQKIQGAIMSGAKMSGKAGDKDMGFNFDATAMLESKYVALECIVKEIKEGEKTSSFTREWMDNLSMADGDTLVEAVDEVSKKK